MANGTKNRVVKTIVMRNNDYSGSLLTEFFYISIPYTHIFIRIFNFSLSLNILKSFLFLGLRKFFLNYSYILAIFSINTCNDNYSYKTKFVTDASG